VGGERVRRFSLRDLALVGGMGEGFWAVTASGWLYSSSSHRLGFRFTVGESDLTVNTLRVYRPGSGSTTENVRIHRQSDGSLIAEADVPSEGTAGYVTSSITQVTLSSGADYVVSSRRVGGASRPVARDPTALSFYSGITLVGYVYGTSDAMPTSSTASKYASFDFGFVGS
jgi:hypothetical protein